MTPRLRTVFAMNLAALPWLQLAAFKWFLPLRLHEDADTPAMFWWRVSIIEGGFLCIVTLLLFASGLRQRQVNPLIIVSALAGAWYLFNWPPLAHLRVFFAHGVTFNSSVFRQLA